MKNPIKAFIEAKDMSTNQLAKEIGMNQPTVHRHAYQDYPLSFISMNAYARAGVPWQSLIEWNNKLHHKKQGPINQGGSNVSGDDPPGGEDL